MVSESAEFIMHHKAHSVVLLVGVEGVYEGGEELDGEVAVGVHAEAGEEVHPDVLSHPLKFVSYPEMDKCVLVGPLCRRELGSQDLRVLDIGGAPELGGLAATTATPQTLGGQSSEKFERKTICIRFI
jgi:hypothetical protein